MKNVTQTKHCPSELCQHCWRSRAVLSTSWKHKAKGTGQLVGGWGMDFPARWANRAAQTAGGESSESPEHIPSLLPPPGAAPCQAALGAVTKSVLFGGRATSPSALGQPPGAVHELGRKCQRYQITSALEEHNRTGGKKSSAFPWCCWERGRTNICQCRAPQSGGKGDLVAGH